MYTQFIKAEKSHADDFAELVLMTGEDFLEKTFGNQVKEILKKLFTQPKNLFSHECTYFGLIEGQIFGVIVGYSHDYARRCRINTGRLLLREIGLCRLLAMVRIDQTLGRHSKGDFYLSNIAIYPKFRSMGLGKKLVEYTFKIAKQQGCGRIILDVEKQNDLAKALYKRMGFEKVGESRIKIHNSEFCFERMSFKISS